LTGSLPASQLSGTLPAANHSGTYGNVVSLSNAGNTLAGNGAALTGLNASALTAGIVPDARLSPTVARTSQVWLLGGNAGTDPDVNFVGTTDTQPLVLRSANREALRLTADTTGVTLTGGVSNSVSSLSSNSAILSGWRNLIESNAPMSSIVGGQDNHIQPDQRSAFIGGGLRNQILTDNQHAVIVGGRDNAIGTNNVITLVVGGAENRVANNVDGGLMIGGFRNDILGSLNPNARNIAPVLIGGSDNEIGYSSRWAVLLGGDNNRIGTNCQSAVILGGTNNVIADNAQLSLAAGRRCRVNHVGSFVWADSQNANFASVGTDTFNIRAAGGIHVNGDTSQYFGSSVRQMINLWSDTYGIGVQSFTQYFRTDAGGGFSWFRGGVHSDSANSPGAGGVEMMRLNSTGLRVNGTFVSASDRNAKENFREVDPEEILARVVTIPISRWNYKEDKSSDHVGPMAQDFHSAFHVGPDDRHIATVDADGVALAAIQGLNRKLERELAAKDAELRTLQQRVAELSARDAEIQDLKRSVAELRNLTRSQNGR
jgi:hypothetical protein